MSLLPPFWQRARYSLGLDIQPDAIRAVLLQRTRKEIKIKDVAYEVLPKDTLVGTQIKDETLLKNILKRVREKLAFPEKTSTNIALPDNAVLVKYVTLRNHHPENIETELLTQLKNELPAPVCDLAFDYIPVEASKHNFQFACASKLTVNAWRAIFMELEWQLTVIDVQSHALMRGYNDRTLNNYKCATPVICPEPYLLSYGLAIRGFYES